MVPEVTSDADVNGDPYISVGEFFAERSVFVTGATGFLGKALVEKLLRSCPEIKNIYLLIRPKKGRSLDERMADIVGGMLFDRLKKENPSALKKMIAIQGDISMPDLGISVADQETLTQHVSVVFHSAATVRFHEPLKVAVENNLLGTKRVMDLSRRMPGLKAMIHVSTAYSNCDLEEVDEVVYPPPFDPESIVQCTQWMDEATMEKVTPILVGKRPNTYTFTKALAEAMVAKEGTDLPIAIVRPSLITPTWKEPMPGWLQGFNGPISFVAAYGKGMLRVLRCNGKKIVDMIPADVVVNLIICAAWRLSTESKDRPVVYNCCSGTTNPTTFDDTWAVVTKTVRKNPPQDIVWYPPTHVYCANKYLYELGELLLHIVPGFCFDLLRRLSHQKPMLVQLHRKIRTVIESTAFVMIAEWRFKDDNMVNLNKCLSETDRQVFFFDVSGIDWSKYVENGTDGARRHLHKEHPDTIPRSRVWLNRLLWIKMASILFVFLLFIYVVMSVFF